MHFDVYTKNYLRKLKNKNNPDFLIKIITLSDVCIVCFSSENIKFHFCHKKHLI